MSAFQPIASSAVTVSASTSSSRTALSTNKAFAHIPGQDVRWQQVRVRNKGLVDVHIEFGDSSITASTTTSLSVGPGGVEIFTVDKNTVTHIAAITVSGSATVEASVGYGE